MSRVAIRYAKAVISLASDQDTASAVNKDMKLISTTISENKNLSQALKNSVIGSEAKKAALTQIFPKLNVISSELINLLITNKRIDVLGDVASKYNVLFNELNGEQIAKVTTAIPMTKDLEAKVLAKVKELTNKSVTLKNEVDESILGGFILRVGDKEYNSSISNKLNKLRREFSIN